MPSTTQIVLSGVMGAAAAWCLRELLTRDRFDPAGVFRWLTAAFAGLALGNTISAPIFSMEIDDAVGAGSGRIVFNALTTAGLCALVCCLRLGTARDITTEAARQLIAREWLLWGAVISVLAIASWGHTFSLSNLSGPGISESAAAVFYGVGNTYFVYAYGFSAWSLWRLLRHGIEDQAYRIGLAIAGASLTVLSCTGVIRAAWVLIPAVRDFQGGVVNTINFAATNTATLAVCIGLGVPVFRQLFTVVRVRQLRRGQCDDIDALWRRLTSAFPDVVFSSEPTRRGVVTEWRLYRRYVECRDGLTRLSPYLAEAAAETDLEELGPEQIANLIDDALTRYEEESRTVSAAVDRGIDNIQTKRPPRTARRVLTSTHDDDFEHDLRTMIAVSRSYKSPRIG